MEQLDQIRSKLAIWLIGGSPEPDLVREFASRAGISDDAPAAVVIPSSEEADITELAAPRSCWERTSLTGYGSRRGGLLLVFTPTGTCVKATGRNGRAAYLGLSLDEIADALEWEPMIQLVHDAVRTHRPHRTEGWGWYTHASLMSDGLVLVVMHREETRD